MTTADLHLFVNERLGEVHEYMALLQNIELAAQSGVPRIAVVDAAISSTQTRILYSSVYLQLYNLVEATISRCLAEITIAAASEAKWTARDLSTDLRREWVQVIARTHIELTSKHRLDHAVEMFDHLVQHLPVADFVIEVGGGGNWDDDRIEKVSGRLGCKFKPSRKAREKAKRPVRDNLGAMKLIKNRRNSLAHGSISFVDCADEVTVDELGKVVDAVEVYVRELAACFADHIDTFGFLDSGVVPASA